MVYQIFIFFLSENERLEKMKTLMKLDLEDNNLTIIECLDNLKNLEGLDLEDNEIKEISSLNGLRNLKKLVLTKKRFFQQ